MVLLLKLKDIEKDEKAAFSLHVEFSMLTLTEAFGSPKCSDFNVIYYLTFPWIGTPMLNHVLGSERLKRVWRVNNFGAKDFLEYLCKTNHALTFFLEHVPQKVGEDLPSTPSTIAPQVLCCEGPTLSVVVMHRIPCWKVAATPGRRSGNYRAG